MSFARIIIITTTTIIIIIVTTIVIRIAVAGRTYPCVVA